MKAIISVRKDTLPQPKFQLAHSQRVALRDLLIKKFNKFEVLETHLLFDLGILLDDIEGRTISAKISNLIGKLERNNRIDDLIDLCREKYPDDNWPYQAKVFIAVNEQSQDDASLAESIREILEVEGHKFLNTSASSQELNQFNEQIINADIFVLLLTEISAFSEVIQSYVELVLDRYSQRGKPHIFLVHSQVEQDLPRPLNANHIVHSFRAENWLDEDSKRHISESLIEFINNNFWPADVETDESVETKGANATEDGKVAPSELGRGKLPVDEPRLVRSIIKLQKGYRNQNFGQLIKDKKWIHGKIIGPIQAKTKAPLMVFGSRGKQKKATVSFIESGKIRLHSWVTGVYLDIDYTENKKGNWPYDNHFWEFECLNLDKEIPIGQRTVTIIDSTIVEEAWWLWHQRTGQNEENFILLLMKKKPESEEKSQKGKS